MRRFDNIIIGAGPGGYKLAAGLAATGESVAVIERDELGGTCLNRGCIPTKCLCATADAVLNAQSASTFGVDCGAITIDYQRATDRMRSVIESLRDGVKAVLSGTELIKGEAVMMGGRRVKVGSDELEATKRLIIATGSCPAVLPIDGAELAMTSDEVLADSQLPESVIIIGGGVIGVEFASIYAALGVKVTIVEFCKEILPPFDAEIAKRLRMALSARGITVVCSAAVKRIDPMPEGRVLVTWQGKREETSAEADRVIMATGRRPILPKGAKEAGVALTERGFIAVDDLMQTSLDGVYAVGDVNGLSMLAHSAYAQGHVVLSGNPNDFCADRVPSVVFSHPEVAQVGQINTPDCHTVKRMFGSNGKAQAMGEAQGIMKITCRNSDNGIVAVSIIGPHASDLIAEATILVTDRVPLHEVDSRYIHAHPTLSELF